MARARSSFCDTRNGPSHSGLLYFRLQVSGLILRPLRSSVHAVRQRRVWTGLGHRRPYLASVAGFVVLAVLTDRPRADEHENCGAAPHEGSSSCG